MAEIIVLRLPFKEHLMDTVIAKTENYTVFFDTGVFSIAKQLESICEGQVVILNTHGDWDHIGVNKYLQDRGAKVMVHKADFQKEMELQQQI